MLLCASDPADGKGWTSAPTAVAHVRDGWVLPTHDRLPATAVQRESPGTEAGLCPSCVSASLPPALTSHFMEHFDLFVVFVLFL